MVSIKRLSQLFYPAKRYCFSMNYITCRLDSKSLGEVGKLDGSADMWIKRPRPAFLNDMCVLFASVIPEAERDK